MGITDEDRAGLDKSLKDLKLSTDEMDKFSKAFKDPEFLKLFEDYAKEVSDPKVKEETDMYLRQLEFEGRMEEVYGKGAQLILPTPAFVVKTQSTADGAKSKAFINICTSDKLDKASLKSSVSPEGHKGQHFDMPLCLGPKKAGLDKSGAACSVWDFVVHPETLGMAATMPAIKKTMIETAMEKIEETNAGHKLHRTYREPKMQYKTTEGCAKPHSLAMRGSGSESINGRVKPVTSPMPPAAPTAAAAAAAAVKGGAAAGRGTASASTSASAHDAGAGAGAAAAAAAARSTFAFPGAKPAAAAAATAAVKAPSTPSTPGYEHPGGEVTPQWELVHRGQIDLSEAWGDAGRGMAINTTHPKELIIRILLPGLTSAANAQLDVSRNDISVCVPGRYRLEATLPFPVNSDQGKAKFDKVKQQLQVTVPVVPPPLPSAPAPAAPQAVPPHCAIASSEAAEAAEEPERPAAARLEGSERPGVVETELQQVVGGDAPSPPAAAAAAAAAVTENQRRWAEVHVAAHSPPQPDAPAAAAAPAQPSHEQCLTAADEVSDGFKLAVAFEGAKAGFVFRAGAQGLGYYRDVVSKPESRAAKQLKAQAQVVEQAKVIKLQPRLNPGLVADLD